ncbi:MAG: exo-alpha-sialidase, partial [Acidobacteria bacterium]|nr:exo-alpha-sialidase [Acidobacteriota bacterium]
MCHRATVRRALRDLTLVLGFVCAATAQTAVWRRVGGSSVELSLASPATGAVDRVWFSPDGSRLFARTHAGRIYATDDFETWTAAAPAGEIPVSPAASVARLPEAGARTVAGGFGRVYALGRQLFRSEDGGRTWTNLTAFRDESVIGSGQSSVAVSATNPDEIVAANRFGVWRSMDGGLSWAGLNQFLPNLAVRRILSTPTGTAGTRVEIDVVGAAELAPGTSVWTPVRDAAQEAESAALKRFSDQLRTDVRSMAVSGTLVYLGTGDGRIMVSSDGGANFAVTPAQAAGPVERLWADPTRAYVALAAIGGSAAIHVLRTVNGGIFWDPLDSPSLPDVAAHGIWGERASGAVYVATDRGVYWARTDLDSASVSSPNWTRLSDSLPDAAATDVRLDPAGVRVYAAIDGYGVYAAAAPHRARNLRIVNSADLSTRPAAPGSLLSVIGGRVDSARGGNLNYPVLAAGDDASQIQVPFAATGPNVTLALSSGENELRMGVQVLPVSPVIFVGSDGAPMLQDSASGLLLDARNPARS